MLARVDKLIKKYQQRSKYTLRRQKLYRTLAIKRFKELIQYLMQNVDYEEAKFIVFHIIASNTDEENAETVLRQMDKFQIYRALALHILQNH